MTPFFSDGLCIPFRFAGAGCLRSAHPLRQPWRCRRAFIPLLAPLLALLSVLLCFPAWGAEIGERLTLGATHTLPYGGLVRQEVAEQTARTLARLEVLRQAAPVLLAQKVVRIGLDTPLQRLSLSSVVLTPLVAVHTDPTAATVTVQADVFTPVAPLPDAILRAISNPEELELRAAALQEADTLAREANELLLRTQERRERQATEADTPFIARLDYLANRLAVMDIYMDLLTRFGSNWQPPDVAITDLDKAQHRDPDNALLRLAQAQTMLRLDRPHDAVFAATEAARLAPDMAAAYMARGVAHLRLGLSALAEADLGRALDLRQDRADWWRARGAARYVQQDFAGMCADLYQACSLGDCEGLSEMREQELCQRP